MKVSIITATYNSAATIQDTLASLESQTYPDIEYIIVDGSSKDNTLEVVKNSCMRVSKIISEPDRGIYDALKKVLRLQPEILSASYTQMIFWLLQMLFRIWLGFFNQVDMMLYMQILNMCSKKI